MIEESNELAGEDGDEERVEVAFLEAVGRVVEGAPLTAADASCARRRKGSLAESAGSLIDWSALAPSGSTGPAGRADKQQGLML